MDKVLVAVLDNERKARAALAALEALADAGAIRLNENAVVSKSPDGAITVNHAEERTPESALGATAIGVLIGMLAGGVGLAVGAAAGLFVGSIADMFYLDVGRRFLADVEQALEPGKAALVAQVWEEDTAPVDGRIRGIGGIVLRLPVSDIRGRHPAAAALREASVAGSPVPNAASRDADTGKFKR